MRFFVGTSGFSYKEWKGRFYPADLPEAAMLRWYAERLSAVEINNTFYRMPTPNVVERWGSEVPEGFRFVLKAPRRITHEKRFDGVRDDISYLFKTASALGGKLGPFLFQLPPFFRKDLGRLDAFLAALPSAARAALEVRHESWLDESVYAMLRARDVALCLSDTEEKAAELVPTARWGYLRMRRPDYGDADLRRWAARLREQPWDEAYVFFKHEEAGRGVELAQQMSRLLAQPSQR